MHIDILSERKHNQWASQQVIYEWEDDISRELNWPIRSMWRFGNVSKYCRKINCKFISKNSKKRQFEYSPQNSTYHLYFVMNASRYEEFVFENAIPIFMDFSEDMLQQIRYATEKCPVFWVTCKHIYDGLKAIGASNVRYMPFSISTSLQHIQQRPKTIDVIQIGRKNEYLHKWMLDYCEQNPSVEYVYHNIGKNSLGYISTTRGNIGEIVSRESYIELLSQSKVSIVSSPGADGSSRFGNIDFITPRFYESAALKFHLIGRYSDMEEVKITGLDRICPNIRSQDEFNQTIARYLMEYDVDMVWRKSKEFISNNLILNRINEIKESITDIL